MHYIILLLSLFLVMIFNCFVCIGGSKFCLFWFEVWFSAIMASLATYRCFSAHGFLLCFCITYLLLLISLRSCECNWNIWNCVVSTLLLCSSATKCRVYLLFLARSSSKVLKLFTDLPTSASLHTIYSFSLHFNQLALRVENRLLNLAAFNCLPMPPTPT